MRIIAGDYRSRRIVAPAGDRTRPTLDQTRESLFNVLQGQVAGARVLDLFAGSGALGLEALSRGASLAVFCDNNREAAGAVRQNLRSLRAEDRARVLQMDCMQALAVLSAEGQCFDLVFLDPPYQMDYGPVLLALARAGILAQGSLVIVEHERRKPLPIPAGLESIRQKEYRDTVIDFVRQTRSTA
ncbi:MAG: 16S rRNA (guanine(966)-N(2))-methyltransferase RsmD [Christensenellales bacterium]